MPSYRQILYHIIFATKDRHSVLHENHSRDLYRYISGLIANKKCTLYRINGAGDHIHILSDLHPSISLSSYVKDIKVSSSIWMKKSNLFPRFVAWQDGYGAFTHSLNDRDRLVAYIKNQREHHQTISFLDELKFILAEHQIEIDERFF